MLNLQEISAFLENLPYTKIKEKEFTLAHIFRKNRNENFSSDWLAYIFDPTLFKSYEPLNAFFKLIDVPTINENQEVVIEREHSFGDYGRIDLLISTDEYLIGIENKIDYWTRDNQCEDYTKGLVNEANGKKVVGILLSPQSNSVGAVGEFKDLSYETLIDGLKSVSIDFINNLRSAFLLKDFITYMEENIMKTDVEFDVEDKTTVYILNQVDKIDEINEFIKAQKGNLKNYLENAMLDLKEKLGEEWDVHISSGCTYWQLYKNDWSKNGINVHYEVVNTDKGRNSLSYTNYQLTMHDESQKKIQAFKDGFKPVLTDVRSAIDIKDFDLDFSSNNNFKKSVDYILDHLYSLVQKTSEMVDKNIAEYKANLLG